MISDDFIITPLIAGLATIGGGSAAAGAAGVAGTVAGLAGAGSSIASATQKAPTMKPTPPPDPKIAEAAKAQERDRATQKRGFKSTILADTLKEYSAPGAKTKLGQ